MKKVGNLLHTSGRTAKTRENLLRTSGRTAKADGFILRTSGRTIKTRENLLRTSGRTAKTDENMVLPQVCDLKPKIDPLPVYVQTVIKQIWSLMKGVFLQ
ncbi:MAG: hypothetical protein LBP64_04000 [Tannerella sp.]|jgi:hypothetical protein|nr:hypothetical protein [Tannerella sp.]